MAMRDDIGDVPFDEAIQFFRQKQNLPTDTWTDLWEGMHARAFVVAGARKAALIEDFRQTVDKAIAEGTTLEDFRRDFDGIVERHGWSYRGSRGWRSRVIFQTNMRMAYASGRWKQVQRLKERRPYLRYSAVLDSRTRPEHEAWHGTVLPVDDPFWNTHYPPNGWNCRCTVQQLSERDLERFGYQRSDDSPPVDMEARQVNTPNGSASVRAPAGIDTGFGYNPGKAAWGQAQQRTIAASHGPWRPLSSPGGARPAGPDDLPVAQARAELGERAGDGDRTELRRLLSRAIGGDERTFRDPTGERILVNQGLVDHLVEDAGRQDGREAFFPLIPELLESPQEIWVGFAEAEDTSRVALRRRYVRLVDLGRNRTVALVADSEQGHWQALTFFRGDERAVKRLRSGLRVYSGE